MIQSMTGFGKSNQQLQTKKITVEVKSLNSKGLDLNVRLPANFREMELGLRTQIAQQLERGKIDCNIIIENTFEQTAATVNTNAIKLYVKQLREICVDASDTELLKMAIRMPDALKTDREELNPDEWVEIKKVIDEAIVQFLDFRKSEGAALEKEFRLRIANISSLMQQAVAFDSERILTIKERLKIAISEMQLVVDANRFEQELIFYIEKYDITEEQVRLGTHLDYFLETLDSQDANGRKLGFITQEMGREINTMGSKANHAGMQKVVVMMKDELEKIKEQVLNVL